MLALTRSHYAVAALLVVWLFAGAAWATDLEDAVTEYNTAAASLQSLWNTYTSDYDDAWDDYELWITNFVNYLEADDLADAADYWEDAETAYASLKNTSGPALEVSFEEFVLQLNQAVVWLQIVLVEDQESTTEVAYVSGTSPFTLSDQPFPFWTDPSWESYDEWVEFTFPLLAVGSSTLYTSYSGAGLNDLFVLLQDVLDPVAWTEFLVWVYDQYDAANSMNQVLAVDWDLLCDYCAETDELVRAAKKDFLINVRGYTEAELEDFCEWYGGDDGLCNDEMYDWEKAAELRYRYRRLISANVDDIKQRVRDYVVPRWVEWLGWDE